MLIDRYIERGKAVPNAQPNKDGSWSRANTIRRVRSVLDVNRDTAQRFRLLTVPQRYQQIHVTTLGYLDTESQIFQQYIDTLQKSDKMSGQQIKTMQSEFDSCGIKIRAALKRAGEDANEFTKVLNEDFPTNAQK